MASTTFTDNQTVIYAAWLNDVNNAVYNGVFQSTTLTATNMVCNGTASGAGFTALVNNVFSAPNPIGSVTPNTGAFTTLTSNGNPVATTTGTQTLTNKTIGSGYGGGVITSGTAVASTSGTSIDFTSIPSWVKRITVMFNGVSSSSTSIKQVQIGAGSAQSTGYTSTSSTVGTTVGTSTVSSGFCFGTNIATDQISGLMVIANVSGNIWVASYSAYGNTTPQSCFGGGTVTLSGALDRVRITTVNGTDTFDAGSINILFE